MEQSNNLQEQIEMVMHLADNSLIMGHRLSEWTGHGPALEQDIALTNIALDLIGQARLFYQHAAHLLQMQDDKNCLTEDDLAYLRDAPEFKNFLLVELPNNDWGNTILKTFFFSCWQYFYYKSLLNSADEQLVAIAEKSLKEIAYHVRWSSEWVIRLGDGTPESHDKMQHAVWRLWPYTGELTADKPELLECWRQKVIEVFTEATFSTEEKAYMHKGGKQGIHTEHLGYLLAEMQFLQRAYPGCTW